MDTPTSILFNILLCFGPQFFNISVLHCVKSGKMFIKVIIDLLTFDGADNLQEYSMTGVQHGMLFCI